MTKRNQKIPVICYHNIGTKQEIETAKLESREWIIEKNFFEKQMKLIKKMGYKTLTLKEFEKWKNNEISLPYRSILITFDDGFFNVYKYAMPILKKYDMHAVVFMVGKYAEKYNHFSENMNLIDKHIGKDKIEECKEKYANIEFACHSYDLHKRRKR